MKICCNTLRDEVTKEELPSIIKGRKRYMLSLKGHRKVVCIGAPSNGPVPTGRMISYQVAKRTEELIKDYLYFRFGDNWRDYYTKD